MATTYAVQVIHADQETRAKEIEVAVDQELRALGLHRSVQVKVDSLEPGPDQPAMSVYLGSRAGATDSAVEAAIQAALDVGRVVIPIVPDLNSFARDTPVLLRAANGVEWSPSTRRLARAILEELGIQDKQRRVFISHKRDDGLWAAEQLFDALSHAGFAPFIDRFSIRGGARVQDAIADALEDHAFLLLLETPLAYTSDWVFDEVDYALSHTMGILIVQWPGRTTPVPGSDGLPRLSLANDDLAPHPSGPDVLSDSALDRVVERVEQAHAQGLCRRRRMLVQSVEEAARAAGCAECLPLPRWRLHVLCGGQSTLVGITPRLPTAYDLQGLDEARDARAGSTKALLVHSARVLRPELQSHLGWAVGDREVALSPENAIGAWW